ncbi:hypothetical protein CYMTET_49825 [Cymbomonas tetramitiformis]|uniref:Uncharacterized protein n=1 Tax=Cymbomonas tetramitiformis TaxID=36881 RepID=A0AAE0BR41_9CHLO|nr:hypothetical protein CYMTET_49825 [Cymbomonas tetramitiformis]
MYGVTDVHEEHNGYCPYACETSFAIGRAPPNTLEAPAKPPTPPQQPIRPKMMVAASQPSADAEVEDSAVPEPPPRMMTLQVPEDPPIDVVEVELPLLAAMQLDARDL